MKNKEFFRTCIKILSIFLLIFLAGSCFIYSYANTYYNNLINETKTVSDNIEQTEEKSTKTNETKTINTDQTLVLIEKTKDYKIYVDKDTKNMYIAPNSYDNISYTLMYDGDVPKIYDKPIN